MKEQELIKKIQKITGIEDFMNRSGRTRAVVDSKMLYSKYKREVEGLTFQQIAAKLGLKQHGSVMNLIERFDNYSKYDKTLRENYNSLDDKYTNPVRLEFINLIDEIMDLDEKDIEYIKEKMIINIKVIKNKK